MIFGAKDGIDGIKTDLAKLLKEEGSLVKELSQVATEAAGLHARLESIEKAIDTDPATYHSNAADELAKEAKEKYTSELEDSIKQNATNKLK